MKQVICIGNHKTFDAARLAGRLAEILQENGQEIVLVGLRGKVPAFNGETVELAPAATAKTWGTALKKIGAQRVLSLACLPACEAALAAKLPYVYCEPENLKEAKPIKNKKTLLQKAKKVLVIGEGHKPLDKKIYGTHAVRVKNPAVWVEHGAAARPQDFKKGNNLLAIGKWGKEGGLTALLTAWAQLAPLHPSWQLTICAEGTGKAAAQKWLEKNQLQADTQLINTADKRALLAHADIYIHPALTAEGLEGLADAMASTLPAVALTASGAEQLITPDVDGLLADRPEQLAALLDNLMVDWGKRVRLAVEARKIKDRFPFEVFASFFEEI